MSDLPHATMAHTGPIQNPKQLLLAVFFSFVIPIFAIIGLVYYVTSSPKPADGAADAAQQIATRLQKVGTVEIRDANRPLRAGADVFAGQCAACHAAGVAGAPKFGDAAAWGPRIQQGFEALVNSALKGKGAMGPQGGGDFEDIEIARAVAHMANAGGGRFPIPDRPAVAAATTADAGGTAAPAAASVPAPGSGAGAVPPAAASATVVAAAPATTAPPPGGAGAPVAAAAADGSALYQRACFACHAAGVAGAPRFGDKAAWAPRVATGLDKLTATVIQGKGAMPPRGGTTATDPEIRATVAYIVNAAK